jgi:hypothetical protein
MERREGDGEERGRGIVEIRREDMMLVILAELMIYHVGVWLTGAKLVIVSVSSCIHPSACGNNNKEAKHRAWQQQPPASSQQQPAASQQQPNMHI